VTLELLWKEYRDGKPDAYSYSRFCELYRAWKKKLHPTMRLDHKAGERAFIDYAGLTLSYFDIDTGEQREASVFVAALGASSYTYAEAQASQELSNWLLGHVRAFEYWSGVPELAVVDNLRSGVTSPCRYEPDVNPAYHDLAVHYGVAVLPARVLHPRDKPKAETAVQVVERWLMAPLRHERLVGLGAVNKALWERLVWLNGREMKHIGKSRRELFEELDQPALKPLPPTPFELGMWKIAKVAIDYHVQYDHHYYSVPYELIHETVDVRATDTVVEVFRKGVRMTSHARSRVRGGHTTLAEHMPKSHRQYLEWTPERVARWAGKIGPNTEQLAAEVMASREHPEQGFRSCLGIVRLSKDYPAERMEAAARRALDHGVLSYKGVKKILANGLDGLPAEEEPAPPPVGCHENLRGSSYYSEGGDAC